MKGNSYSLRYLGTNYERIRVATVAYMLSILSA